ncbi:SDR family NAD(P)-dependent oxidoreductase [Cryptosporangium phraense]|uniref:SDR family oxidoreductase n=1 Tax=Cryptosporangium phraense TaxID=2593070 RepID=A0A545AU02_9ACTN|nr:SDR family NAD(P)-dependent oxidoreductase [Cryptosporangium phraense]TQS44741.1 SDR family oxidoreductase [Cryptosporangium phraense]
MGDRFAGKTALVTGAAGGIGAACAARLAAEGASVVLTDVRPAEEAAEKIRAAGGRATAVVADASDEDAWRRTASACGPVDVLVSNAVLVDVKPAHETSRESWDRQLAVSLTGSFLGVRALLPSLRAAVLISSVHALVGLPGRPAYAAAKGALVSLGRQLAVEYGPALRVNVVLPGPILTDAWAGFSRADRERSAAATVAGRLGDPAEVAAAVAFLASDEAAFITGTTLVVDGGWTASKSSS